MNNVEFALIGLVAFMILTIGFMVIEKDTVN